MTTAEFFFFWQVKTAEVIAPIRIKVIKYGLMYTRSDSSDWYSLDINNNKINFFMHETYFKQDFLMISQGEQKINPKQK